MKKIKRQGNIELRETCSAVDNKPYFEIVCYYPNPRYGYYNADGKEEFPELCYTVSFIERIRESDEHDILSVGSRPFCLDEQDKMDYDAIAKETYKPKIRKLMLKTIKKFENKGNYD